MTHRSRTRWVIAGLALLAFLSGGLVFSSAPRRGTEPASANDSTSSRFDAATGVDATGRPRRMHDTGAAAEAKLRSLLEVREGEISCIHVPAEMMAEFPLALQGEEIVGGTEGPGLVGIVTRQAVLEGLKDLHSNGGGIEGSVDASAEEFEWSGKRFEVVGTALTGSTSTRLRIEAREGENMLECITNLPPGGIVLLRSSGPNPEGILLVAGQRAAEEKAGP